MACGIAHFLRHFDVESSIFSGVVAYKIDNIVDKSFIKLCIFQANGM